MRFLVSTVTPYPVPEFTATGNTYPTMFAAAAATNFSQTYCVY